MANKQLVWGCVEYKTIWEAEYAVKFPVLVPGVLGTGHINRIAVIGNELVDIQYANDICYRTAKGTEDISGDYNKYEKETTFEVQGGTTYHVTAKGGYGKIFLAIWTDDTYSYSVYVPHGVSKDSLKALIESLAQVNSNGTMADAAVSNPIVEYHYIFEAEYAVNFNITIPAVLGLDKVKHIYVISNKVVELQYKNDIVYRTARGEGDISGIYEAYPCVETFEEGGVHVTAKGNKDLYYVSVWSGYGMTWSLYCPHGIHKKNLITFISSLRQADGFNLAAGEGLTDQTALGAYSPYHVVTEEEEALFYEAVHLIGVEYEPLLAAVQLVAGTNYRYICNAKAAALNSSSYLAQVTVFVPISAGKQKKPELIDIKRLD